MRHEGPRPRRHRLHRVAPGARTCSSTATTWWPRRRRRPDPTASAGTTASARSGATSPTRRRSPTAVDGRRRRRLPRALARPHRLHRPRPRRRRDRRGRGRRERRTSPRLPVRPGPRACRRASCPPTSPRVSRSSASCSPRTDGAVALRAGVVIGAGSTSFEIIRQIATLFLVQPVPTWMRSSVQPVAVSDVLRAMTDALADDGPRGAVDLGGPDVVAYPDLMRVVAGEAGLTRLRVPAPVAPTGLVGLGAALVTTAPFHTVTALIESLRHDMVCRPGAHVGAAHRRPAPRPRRGRPAGADPEVRRPRGRAALGPDLDPTAAVPGRRTPPGRRSSGRAARPAPGPFGAPRRLTVPGGRSRVHRSGGAPVDCGPCPSR